MFLEVRNVSKSYGETPVLQDVSFGLPRGQCLALLGPSGCGKSTLLNVIAGLMPADGGSILCRNETIEDAERRFSTPPQRRGFAMVFQDLNLWPHMRVSDNVRFGLDYLKGLSRQEKDERVEKALRRVGIFEFRHRYPNMLSGGQQQRVAIARAIVVEPEVLLMDEPLASLDAQLREELRTEIAALIRRLNITTVYVTHDYLEAMTVAHEVAIMKQGCIEQIATPETFRNNPATTFVADFLGTASHFPYLYELEGLRRGDGSPLFPPHPRGVTRGHLMVPRANVEILPVNGSLRPAPDNFVRFEAVCVRTSMSEHQYEILARTPKGDQFRGFVRHPIAIDDPVIVQFDAKHVSFLEE